MRNSLQGFLWTFENLNVAGAEVLDFDISDILMATIPPHQVIRYRTMAIVKSCLIINAAVVS